MPDGTWTNHSTPLRRWKVARSCLIGLGHVPWPRPLRWASLGDIHAVWETFVVNHLEKILKVGTFANFGDSFWMKFGVSGNLILWSGPFSSEVCIIMSSVSWEVTRRWKSSPPWAWLWLQRASLVGCNRRIELGIEMSETELRWCWHQALS